MNIKSIVAATGIDAMDKALSSINGFEVVEMVKMKKDLEEACSFYKPDLIVVSDALRGSQSMREILFNISSKEKSIRIIYLIGDIDMRDRERVDSIGYLVMNGVYDIITEKKFNMDILTDILLSKKTLADVQHYTKYISENAGVSEIIQFEEEVDPDLDDGYNPYNKIYIVSSVKPGSGKTTVAVNVATAIAKYGKVKRNGERPKVALVEADLQNLSIGTLLQIESKKNLKTAIDKISELFNDEGDLIAKASKMDEVNKFVKGCFHPFYHVKNLEALTGSQLKYSEIKDIKPYHYIYLLESILDDYDVVIVDTNSSVEHTTTEPMLLMAKTCYYVFNLDYNNVRNNARYKSTLRDMGVLDKVKYILNEDIDDDCPLAGTDIEPLEFTKEHLSEVGFKTVANIPMLPKAIFLNRLHDGKPVVLDEGNEHTKRAKYEFFKICNEIWEIDGFKQLEEDIYGSDDISKEKRKKGLFW